MSAILIKETDEGICASPSSQPERAEYIPVPSAVLAIFEF